MLPRWSTFQKNGIRRGAGALRLRQREVRLTSWRRTLQNLLMATQEKRLPVRDAALTLRQKGDENCNVADIRD